MDEEEIARKALRENPLAAFSIYTQVQFDALKRIRSQMKAHCPLVGANGRVSAAAFQEYYDLFWLWTLGAYEVLRTMTAHSVCFTQETQARLQHMKRSTADVRIPFAKQELRGQKRGDLVFYDENSVKDIKNGLVFVVDGKAIETEEFMDSIIGGIESIELRHIKMSMPIARPKIERE